MFVPPLITTAEQAGAGCGRSSQPGPGGGTKAGRGVVNWYAVLSAPLRRPPARPECPAFRPPMPSTDSTAPTTSTFRGPVSGTSWTSLMGSSLDRDRGTPNRARAKACRLCRVDRPSTRSERRRRSRPAAAIRSHRWWSRCRVGQRRRRAESGDDATATPGSAGQVTSWMPSLECRLPAGVFGDRCVAALALSGFNCRDSRPR